MSWLFVGYRGGYSLYRTTIRLMGDLQGAAIYIPMGGGNSLKVARGALLGCFEENAVEFRKCLDICEKCTTFVR